MKKTKLFIVILGALITIGAGKSDVQEGKDYFIARQPFKAIDSFTRAIQANPKEQEAYFFRGAVYSAMGQFDEAIKDYDKVIELNPQYSETYWSRAYCYANKWMSDEALADYTKALNLGTPNQALVYQLRAGAYFRKKMFDEAESDLKAALKLKPGDTQTIKGLEEIKRVRADPNFDPQALKFRPINDQPQYGGIPPNADMQRANNTFIDTVVKSYGTRERACEESLKFGWEYYKKGDYSTAMKRFNQAWLLNNKNPEILHGYSLVLKAWGYKTEADEWEKKAIAGGYKQ